MQRSSCRTIDNKHLNDKQYQSKSVGCLVLSHDGKILLQMRDNKAPTFSGYLATFGGGIETGETPLQALVRELKEELGAVVHINDVVFMGAISEPETNYSNIVYTYFWHDKQNTITGCYEGELQSYIDPVTPQLQRKVMNDVCWLISECQKYRLLK